MLPAKTELVNVFQSLLGNGRMDCAVDEVNVVHFDLEIYSTL